MLRTLLGRYPSTAPLLDGKVASPHVAFDFADAARPSSAFKRVVRDLEFDVAELAIVTYLMARAYDKPLVLLPAVVMARDQHPLLVHDSSRGTLRPADLAGLRIGIRSHSVTTVVWIRGMLAHDGVDLSGVQWVAFEDAHVAEFTDPPGSHRAAPGKTMVDMLRAGELDAAIVGELPDDPRIAPVFPDPGAAAQSWRRATGAQPINHLVVVKSSLRAQRPDTVREIYRMLAESKRAAGLPAPGELDVVPFGVERNRRSLEIAIDYTHRQGLIPRPFRVDELFDDVTRELQ